MRGRKEVGLALVIVALTATAASGIEHPDEAVGFAAGGLQNLAVDSISTYNGGLTIAVPIGPLFQLVYNSHPWSTSVRDVFFVETFPNPRNNAGFGWRLSLGKLYSPNSWYGNETGYWVWVGPDGSSHNFYQDLHEGEDDGDDDTLYSRDGSYLRLRMKWQGTQWKKAVEFPNGTRHVFEPVPGWATNWELSRIEDRFGNATTITYEYPNGDWVNGPHDWTITDPYGRTHYVHFENRGKLTSVDYQAFAGQRAVYQFVYKRESRDRPYDTYPYNGVSVWIDFLKTVILPDGSELSTAKADGSISYYGWYNGWVTGVISGLQLPTGGRLEWDLEEWEFPTLDPMAPNKGAGVTHRRMVRSNGAVESTITYVQSHLPASGWPKVASQTDVLYPGGHCTRHFFHHEPSIRISSSEGWLGWDHGLAYRKDISDGARYLSEEVWDATAGSACSGTKLRSTYVQYEHDKLPNGTHPLNQDRWFASNIRLSNQRVVFHDDGDRYIDVLNEDSDGLGHYRRVTTAGDLGLAGESRSTVSNFNPGRGTYEIDTVWNTETQNHNYIKVTPGDEWILGLFDSIEAAEPLAYDETEARAEFQFDPATGFLLASRQLASGKQRSANDLLVLFEAGPGGEVVSEAVYGGDTQALDTGPGWSAPATWVRKTQHTYEFGVRKASQVIRPNGMAFEFKTYDVDLDPSTGLVVTSRDPSGLATTYDYDVLGRLIKSTPAEGAEQTGVLTHASGGAPAKVRLTARTQGGSTIVADQEASFDDFGRLWKERRWVPDLGWVERETLYDASGAKASVSAWGDFLKKTEFLEYDAFGRPTRVRPPEGAAHDRTFSYKGEREMKAWVPVATSESGEAPVPSIVRRDSFGRLRQVAEQPFTNNTWMSAFYRYSVGGKLASIWRSDPTTGTTQSRRFVYDNRGFLLKEKHPEKGASGLGWVYYYDYDALGNPGRVLDGSNHLEYTYDALGRTIRVDDWNRNRPLKEFLYDGAPGRGAGKLWQATRHNYVTFPGDSTESDAWVMETYEYSGLGGLPSRQTTRFERHNLQYSQEMTYTELGQLETLTYPACDAGFFCPAVPAPSRSVPYTYDRGHLRTVGGWTDAITYHPSGARSAIPRTNAVTDLRDVDASSPDRLARFYTSGAQPADWDSGPMQFDGAGNIKSAGSEVYVYDKVNRLVSGTSQGESQSYTYDAFTNLTSITDSRGAGYSRSIAVVPSTNRLSMASYDAAGNMLTWGGLSFTFDSLNSLVQMNGQRTFLYNAADQRVAVIDDTVTPRREAYSVRDLQGKTLRIFGVVTGTQEWVKDFIYAGSNIVGSDSPDNGPRHYHRDHLGSLRLVTDENATVVGLHAYFPYGDERSDASQNDEKTKYTGHFRDENAPGSLDDLDYMMARFYSPHLGRFSQADEVPGDPQNPTTLNRYSYANGGPTTFVDPTGNWGIFFCGLGLHGDDCPQNVGGWLDELQGRTSFGYLKAFASWDVVGAAAWLWDMYRLDPSQPILLLGYSHGGAAAVYLSNFAEVLGIPVNVLIAVDPVPVPSTPLIVGSTTDYAKVFVQTGSAFYPTPVIGADHEWIPLAHHWSVDEAAWAWIEPFLTQQRFRGRAPRGGGREEGPNLELKSYWDWGGGFGPSTGPWSWWYGNDGTRVGTLGWFCEPFTGQCGWVP